MTTFCDPTEQLRPSSDSPTGYVVPVGKCGARGCPNHAVYECWFRDWPPSMSTGACDWHARQWRSRPELIRMATWSGAR